MIANIGPSVYNTVQTRTTLNFAIQCGTITSRESHVGEIIEKQRFEMIEKQRMEMIQKQRLEMIEKEKEMIEKEKQRFKQSIQ